MPAVQSAAYLFTADELAADAGLSGVSITAAGGVGPGPIATANTSITFTAVGPAVDDPGVSDPDVEASTVTWTGDDLAALAAFTGASQVTRLQFHPDPNQVSQTLLVEFTV